MKTHFILFGFLLISFFSFSQNTYTLYSLTVIQYDTVVWKGDCAHFLEINDSIIRLKQDQSVKDFYEMEDPDDDNWQTLRSFTSTDKPAYSYNFRLAYFDEFFKEALLWEVDGEDRVLYSIIIETAESASNNIRYAYVAYKN